MAGGGLTLRVHPSGGKNWVLRLTVDGNRRNFGLGGYPDVSLKAAREQAEGMRQLAQDGVAPAVHIEAQRIKKASIPTFTEAADKVIELRAPRGQATATRRSGGRASDYTPYHTSALSPWTPFRRLTCSPS